MATPNIAAANVPVVPTVLVSTRIAVTTDSAVYTVGANKAVKLSQGSICNTSTSPVHVGLSIVPSGGTIGDGTHKIMPDTFPLGAGDTLPLADFIKDHLLGDGDIIAMHVDTANVVTVVVSGAVMG